MSEGSPTTPAAETKWIVTLVFLGVATLVLYRICVHANGVSDIVWFLKLVLIQLVIYFGAAWLSLRTKDSNRLLLIGLVFAAIFRLSILFAPPYLSDDIYRYIWDGRVQSTGINPYRYIPADDSLSQLRDDKIYPNINRRNYARTMYPPVAEGAFLLITRFSESVTWMKAAMIGCDAVSIWAIIQLLTSLGMARQRVLIYAWHPLVVWEFAGSGHLDALAIAFISLALLARWKHKDTLTGILLGCAVGVKLFPAVLFPALYKRWGWKMPLGFVAALLIMYLPYLSVGPLGVLGFLPGYASERGMMNGDQFFLLGVVRRLFGLDISALAYLVFAVLILALLSLWLLRVRQENYLRYGLLITSVFMFLLSPHFSWYFCWLIVFLCFIPSIPVLYLTAASFLLYLTWINDTIDRVLLLKALMYVPFLILGILSIWLNLIGSRQIQRSVGESLEIE